MARPNPVPSSLVECSDLFDGVRDPLRQQLVLVGPAPFLQVIGDAGRNRVGCDLLDPLPYEEDEGEIVELLADRFEELDTVPTGYVVVADDAVERLAAEAFEAFGSARGALDDEFLVRYRQIGPSSSPTRVESIDSTNDANGAKANGTGG